MPSAIAAALRRRKKAQEETFKKETSGIGDLKKMAQRPSIEALSEEEREDFEERAAIMEFDGGFPRDRAELEAWKLITGRRGK
jgi:hypothetical protein